MPTCASDGFAKRVRRVVRARRVAHGDRDDDVGARAARRASRPSSRSCGKIDVGVLAARPSARPLRAAALLDGVVEPRVRTGHEREPVDELAAVGPAVAACAGRRRSPAGVSGASLTSLCRSCDHHVVALVFAGIEVLVDAAVVGTEAAAVVPVGAREEPPVAAFAEQRVPHAADLRAVDAGAAVGRAADAVDVSTAAEVVAADRVLAARVRSAVARLRFEAERDVAARRC